MIEDRRFSSFRQSYSRSLLVRLAVSAHDALAFGLVFLLGIYVRTGSLNFEDRAISIAGFIAIAAVVAWIAGLNRGIWRYASIADLQAIAVTATSTVAVYTVLLFVFNRLEAMPRSSLFLIWVFVIAFLSGPRVAYRIVKNRRSRAAGAGLSERNVLLVGTGDNAVNFVRATRERSDLNYTVVGIIDPRGKRVGQTIRGARILGAIDKLESTIERLDQSDLSIDAIILTTPSLGAGNSVFETVAKVAVARRIELLRLPDVGTSITSEMQEEGVVEPRPIRLADLLSRHAVKLDGAPVVSLVEGKRVVVTGAGGSIGSELCRQLLSLKPAQILLVDSSEFHLYSIQHELLSRGAVSTEVVARIGNVRNREAVQALFNEFKPEIVFHAAALKHVPIVEVQPLEGLSTNVVGTRNVADAAVAVNARAMVLVSTDKAINPTNVMGASKRMAEMYCQALDGNSSTRFVTVRFGNVLGSAGSVVPLFEKQIAAGGPVTVTHPEIERFFMTIPEAVELILQATARGVGSHSTERGRIFVLDMGQPMKIVDIARKMIRLSGREPEKEIQIKFIGLRPGEKLYEELFDRREELVATEIAGLLVGAPSRSLARPAITEAIEEVERHVQGNQLHAAMEVLRSVVTEYSPDQGMLQRLAAPAQAQPVIRIATARGNAVQ